MARVGRKPLPANVHILRGNPSMLRPDELRDGINPEVKLPKAPTWLLPAAKRQWKQLGAEMEKLGIISVLDRGVLARYCQNTARLEEVDRAIQSMGDDAYVDQTPSGYKQISVYLQIHNRLQDQLRRDEAVMGLTPSARVSLQPSAQHQMSLFDDDNSAGGKTGTSRFFRD